MARQIVASIDDSVIEAKIDETARATQQLAGRTQAIADRLFACEGAVFEASKLADSRRDDMARIDRELVNRATAAESRLAELESIIATIKVRLPSEINVQEVGCKANDPDFDNGVPINTLLRRLGGNDGGDPRWLNTSLYLPGGGWWFTTPIETPRKTGLRIRGNGLTYALNENHYYSPNEKAFGGPASRLIYAGKAATAIRLRSLGDIWDGVAVQRGPLPNNRDAPVYDGSIAIELAGDPSPPVGKAEFRSIAVLGFDTAFLASGTSGDSHADESTIGVGWIQDCRTVFRSNGVQATQWHFRDLKVAGKCETVFDWQRGGGMLCDHLSLMSSALVFLLNEPSEHLASFKIGYLKVDGACPGWRLVEVSRKAWLLLLSVWGEIGCGATPGAEPVLIRGPAGKQFVDIQMVDGNTWAMWDWKKVARMETAK